MSAPYVPQVGDRVRTARWSDTSYMDVIAVGQTAIFGIDEDGDEWCPDLDVEWLKVETPTPLPERWLNFDSIGIQNNYPTRAQADAVAADDRIALIHIWTDADGVDRIERVTA